MRIGLLAESELPLKVLDDLAPALEQKLTSEADDGIEWTTVVARESVPLDDDGRIPLDAYAAELRGRLGCDMLVYLSDLPRLVDHAAFVADLMPEHRAVLISGPSLGLALRQRTRKTVLAAVKALVEGDDDALSDRPGATDRALGPVRRTIRVDDGNVMLQVTGLRGYTRLLLGMVRTNRPWRLAPALSSATAAAAGTGAFGIFYSSIWSMAHASSPLRLALVGLLAIAVMSTWLIAYNGLWERDGLAPGTVIHNASMLATVTAAVAMMYVLLYLLILVGALAVIDGEYMSQQLGEPASLVDYLALAWLSASMGMVAGALGSTWDGDQDVREAVFSRRTYQRRAQTSGWEKSG
ncbi:hypothetical protein GCM10023169_28460 [Georgenia halophila]|uniref:Uncharacterized protein n=1 Tax=Georgenia halophila TaxID=620889 RepID=A0ABP8LEZ1_9MICO